MNDNIYDNPEKFGLEIVATLDAHEMWEFDIFVLFRRLEDGALFWAQDSGCSCPAPFEDHTYEGLYELPKTASDLIGSVNGATWGFVEVEKVDFLREVRDAGGLA